MSIQPNDWTTAKWAQVDLVIEFLKPRLNEAETERYEKTFEGWRRREKVGFFTLDSVLVDIGLHPMQLPEEVWV